MSVKIEPISWTAHQTDIQSIRMTVFVQEQQVPVDIEMDGRDVDCLHVLAFVDNHPIGTGRIDLVKEGKIGRLAVLNPFRRQGIGTALIAALEVMAGNAGLAKVWLNAQTSALDFYERLGYQPLGPEFIEANIPHRKMEKRLP